MTQAEVIFVIGANPTVEPPGRRDLDQERGEARHQADRLPTRAAPSSRATRTRYLQFKPDTDVALLNAMMHAIVDEGLVDEAFVASRTSGYEELQRQRRGLQPGGDGADLRHRRRDASAKWRALFATSKGVDDPVGHGHLAARARHRQRALPDRAVADDRPDRPARHRPASAARPEQRAGRVATPA